MTNSAIYIMAAVYIFSGSMHFLKPKGFARIIPPWLPGHYTLVYVSGIAEIILGLLLLPDSTRPFAAWGIVLLLIAVFPANVYMAQIFYRRKSRFFWLTVLRLPLQFFLIWWAWLYT